MIKSDNILWARAVAPNLHPKYYSEYMFLLGSYSNCRVTSARPSLDPKDPTFCFPHATWSFPFLDIDQDFNHEEYELWCEMVEQDMMNRHHLTESDFTS